mgnify:CR=1 FL=1
MTSKIATKTRLRAICTSVERRSRNDRDIAEKQLSVSQDVANTQPSDGHETVQKRIRADQETAEQQQTRVIRDSVERRPSWLAS